MPSTFEAEFLADAAPELLSEMGETITFLPAGKDSRSITAIVKHEATPLEDQRSVKRRVESILVWTLDNATTGFTDDELHTGSAVLLSDDSPTEKWAFGKDRPDKEGGMIAGRFMRVTREETGDLTPRLR